MFIISIWCLNVYIYFLWVNSFLTNAEKRKIHACALGRCHLCGSLDFIHLLSCVSLQDKSIRCCKHFFSICIRILYNISEEVHYRLNLTVTLPMKPVFKTNYKRILMALWWMHNVLEKKLCNMSYHLMSNHNNSFNVL